MKILKNKAVLNFMSIIWGIGLSCMFYKICNDRDCIVLKAPNINLIKENTWKYNKKCYNFDIESTTCNNSPIK